MLLAIFALVRLQFLWLPLVGEWTCHPSFLCTTVCPSPSSSLTGAGAHGIVIALVLTIMNTLAFSRCDKFSHAQNLAGSALYSSNLAGSIASNMVGRFFSRS